MPDLTTRAEEAFLGAIISEPSQLSDLRAARPGEGPPLLAAGEFTDPVRRAVWTAISQLSDIAPGARGPEMTDLILAATDDPLITRDYLTQLALSAPTPTAACVYARMVAEAAVIRELAAATADAPASDGSGHARGRLTRLMASYAANLTAARSAPADDMASPGPPPQDQRAIREEQFLAGLIGQQALADWITLDPGIFTTPGLRHIYQAVLDVDRLGEPADEVTLTWAAVRNIANSDYFASRTTTAQSLTDAIPPGTIARLTTTTVDPLTALQAGRDLLADHALTQIDAQASAARGIRHDLTAGIDATPASSRGQVIGSENASPLLRPPDHQPQYGPQFGQEGN